MVKVLFVCLGNICRSPTAEGVFRAKVAQAGLASRIEIDSAGTSDWHVGKQPDARAIATAKLRHYDLTALRARQAIATDFEYFDYVLAMDESNFDDLKVIAGNVDTSRLFMFLDFSSQQVHKNVPDPYYGGEAGFNTVLDLIEDAADGLLADIQQQYLGC